MSYTSLSEALEQAAISGVPLVTVRFAINYGRTTAVEYRNTFSIAEEDHSEITATVALLRKYGKRTGKSVQPYSIVFSVGGRVETWASDRLAQWLFDQAGMRETVPADLVEQLEVGTETVVAQTVAEDGRRSELEALKVEDIRRLAASYKLAGAWKTRKAELIDAVLAAEQGLAAKAS